MTENLGQPQFKLVEVKQDRCPHFQCRGECNNPSPRIQIIPYTTKWMNGLNNNQ